MCKSKKPKSGPEPEDPAVTQARIEAEASKKANAKIADRKRGNRTSMLSTGAGFSDGTTPDTFG